MGNLWNKLNETAENSDSATKETTKNTTKPPTLPPTHQAGSSPSHKRDLKRELEGELESRRRSRKERVYPYVREDLISRLHNIQAKCRKEKVKVFTIDEIVGKGLEYAIPIYEEILGIRKEESV